MKLLANIGLLAIAMVLARILTYWLGDWTNHILLGCIFHLYWTKSED